MSLDAFNVSDSIWKAVDADQRTLASHLYTISYL